MGPIYIQKFAETNDMKEIKSILAKYDVPFWDYSSDTTYLKREYFYDNPHLNDKGAKLFSTEIASRIKRFLAADSTFK